MMQLNMSLHELFDVVINMQMVLSKQATNKNKDETWRNVKIIEAINFFEYLYMRGVRKSSSTHQNL